MLREVDWIWFEFIESKIFSRQVRELPAQILSNIQSDLIQNPERGDIVRVRMACGRPESAIPSRHEERAGAIDIFIFTLNMLAGFTCCTCLAKVSNLTCRRNRNESLER